MKAGVENPNNETIRTEIDAIASPMNLTLE
jgi:hypothetical protein